ncbi:hypothetical protein [Ktedonospora formicarum]|uniref:Uncharacterized protein n=1 Tax=Ktedonospora formicarum TaxID=2778364 RepID=A0A8J3MWY7_9CHLR|nr:hypothetical protein [Ktedonospora formicarum]GHO49168.1 hypothetical protein KSX_73310 [Ktedonospora formicarum]
MTTHLTSPIPASLKAALAQPFAPEQIEFLPKDVRRNKAGALVCRALPYANKRIYEDRLNELAFGLWSIPYVSPFQQGNKLIVPVTVSLYGVPHTDYGEAFIMLKTRKGAERENENSATEAYSQGFRRACAHFLLGRYLYNLASLWLPYDGDANRLALSEGERIAWVEKLYLKAGLSARPTQHSVPQQRTEHPAPERRQAPEVQASPPDVQAPSPKAPAVQPSETVLTDTIPAPTTKGQLASLEKLRQYLNITTPLPNPLGYEQAAELLQAYSQQYQQRPKAASSSQPRVNTLFVEWIRTTVQHDPERIARICKHYQIARLENLTHEQSRDLTQRLKHTKQNATPQGTHPSASTVARH